MLTLSLFVFLSHDLLESRAGELASSYYNPVKSAASQPISSSYVMASFTIPVIFTRETRPDRQFCLEVSSARNDPNLVGKFASDTWTSLSSTQFFLGNTQKKQDRWPIAKDLIRQRCQAMRTQRFSSFPFLPLELQDQIWEACIEPVTHTVLCLVEVDPDDKILSKTWLLESPGKKADRRTLPVPLYHICQRSRDVGRRFYRLIKSGVYYSPRVDTLRLSVISATKVTRRDPPRWDYRATSSAVRGPFFSGESFFQEMHVDEGAVSAVYSYHPCKQDWTSSYKSHLHDYGPPYILTRLSPSILKEVENLDVMFYYEPYASIGNQEGLSHVATYFLSRDCPLLDLTGLRHLSLKIAVVTFGRRRSLDEGEPSWRRLMYRIAILRARRQDDNCQGLPCLQSISVSKVCAVARGVFKFSKDSSALSARLHQARQRLLTRLGRTNWRP